MAGGLQQAADAFAGVNAGRSALGGNLAPGVGYLASLQGASPLGATAARGAVSGLQGDVPGVAQGAITAMSQLAGYSPLASLGAQVLGPAVASDLRGETGESTRQGMQDNTANALMGLAISNPVAAALYGGARMMGFNPSTAIRGTYSDALGGRVGGLLGDDVAFQMMDNVPMAYNMPGVLGSLRGQQPSFRGVQTQKGFLTPAMLAEDVQAPAPVEDATINTIDPGYINEGVTVNAIEPQDMPTVMAMDEPGVTDRSYGIYGPDDSHVNDMAVGDTLNDVSMSAPYDSGFTNASPVGYSDMSAPVGYGQPSSRVDAPDSYFGDPGFGSSSGGLSAGGPGQGTTSEGGPGDGGGGGGDGGGKVICTELYRQGIMPCYIFRADNEFGLQQSADVLAGYWLWAKPLVKVMRKSPIFTRLVAMVAMPWAYHMAYTMGAHGKDNLLGKGLMTTFKPICGMIGRVLAFPYKLKGA